MSTPAGAPGAVDSPNAYPYARTPGNLFDVTSGNNGSCGAPNGTVAFTASGSIGGVTVTNPVTSPAAPAAGNQSGITGSAVSLQLSASGGTAPYTWTPGPAPACRPARRSVPPA